MSVKRKLAIGALGASMAAAGLFGLGGAASAEEAEPFLCPVVGDGVNHAPGRADAVVNPPVGTSFLPGKNQAGANANANALNTQNPDSPTAGPGHNPDFSPIWPG